MVIDDPFFAKLRQKRVIFWKIYPGQQASQATWGGFGLLIPETGGDWGQGSG
jgi:hypothetical protein